MKPSEVREMGDEDLYGRLAESQQELFNLRFQHVTGQLDNYSRLSEVRRDIARIQTVLREREIEAAEAEEAAREREMAATEQELSNG
jgi:large subunit ribosomal protein L29